MSIHLEFCLKCGEIVYVDKDGNYVCRVCGYKHTFFEEVFESDFSYLD